jgi:hypothetical protein
MHLQQDTTTLSCFLSLLSFQYNTYAVDVELLNRPRRTKQFLPRILVSSVRNGTTIFPSWERTHVTTVGSVLEYIQPPNHWE